MRTEVCLTPVMMAPTDLAFRARCKLCCGFASQSETYGQVRCNLQLSSSAEEWPEDWADLVLSANTHVSDRPVNVLSDARKSQELSLPFSAEPGACCGANEGDY